MTTPRIPLELQELVIDLIDDDRDYGVVTATLRSCTLTCRAWFPRSRRRLYRRLSLINIRPTVLSQLGELIDRDPEVPNGVQILLTQAQPEEGEKGEGEENAESDERAKEVQDEENDDKGAYAYDEEDRNHSVHNEQQQQRQRETSLVKMIVSTEAVLLSLSGKLPRLASLAIWKTVLNSPARLPMLAGFPALTTLELYYVTISSYGAFQQMLAVAPSLRRLIVSEMTLTSTHISPTIQYCRLRCPQLTQLLWTRKSSLSDEQSDSAVLAHLLRNLHVCRSLEYLIFCGMKTIDIDNIIAIVTSNRFPDSLVFRNLSTLGLDIYLHEDTAQDVLSGLLRSTIRLIATLWPSDTHALRRRTIRLEFLYPGGTPIAVADADSGHTSLNRTEDIPERLLRALKDVSAELERMLSAIDWNGSAVVLVFEERRAGARDVSEEAEILRAFIVSLRSRVAGIFPELHRRGILSVKFRTWYSDAFLENMPRFDWVEDSKGNFEGIPFRWSVFD
ncbi:hypothetical protein C8T65DRAFT_280501 [Cerioporus squamosus]|nr:hypothetical protein C8T65DRAFT_280501 [Cerioporus squamosus]